MENRTATRTVALLRHMMGTNDETGVASTG